MRRTSAILAALLAAMTGFGPASADAGLLVQRDLGAGAFVSANLTYVGTIPVEAIGGRMLTVGQQKRFYVTGAAGLVIYDVTDPVAPKILGALPLAHFQNEDVDVSDDGGRVIIATDMAHAGPDGRAGTGSIRVIDTYDPLQPRITGYIAASNHTATCADPSCSWIYGATGRIYHVDASGGISDTGRNFASGVHAVNRDESGLVITDQNPRRILDVSSPLTPTTLSSGFTKPGEPGPHNNVRPRALDWKPRAPGDDAGPMRPGELVVGAAETALRASCGTTAGGLSTWDIRNFDRGAPMKQLEIFRPINGRWADGNPAVNALGCSAHWFTVHDSTVAAGWYEHGTRIVDVDPGTGKLTQRAYFQPVLGSAGAAHWTTDAAGTPYVFTTDYVRGIDILRYDRDAPVPSQAEFDASWVANLGRASAAAAADRRWCRLAVEEAAQR